MLKFDQNEAGIKQEGNGGQKSEVRVVKVDKPVERVVTQFKFGQIEKSDSGDYAAIKARYGALASTDVERAERSQRDRRFMLNPLRKDPLSVEEEERRVIEAKVREKVDAIIGDVREKAIADGYAEGLRKGHEDAFSKLREEGVSRLARFDSFLSEVESAKGDIFRANERFLIELIYKVARAILLKELSADKGYLLRLTRELIERIGLRENIHIRVNPEDVEIIGQLRDGLEGVFGVMKNLNIETSTQVKLGGCLIETEWNAIDASIETQLKGVLDAVIGAKDDSGETPA
jgi:flagellar assembly protein FliH